MTITKERLLEHRNSLVTDRNNHLTTARFHKKEARKAVTNAEACEGALQQVNVLLRQLAEPEPEETETEKKPDPATAKTAEPEKKEKKEAKTT